MRKMLLVVGLVSALSAPAHAEGLRAAQRDGYARLVFDWDSAVRYSAEVLNGQLVVQFERAITGGSAAADPALADYVTSPGRLSPDGRTLTYTLKPNINMRTFPVGNAVVIDLSPTTSPTAAQATPQPAAAPARQAAATPAPRPATPAPAATPAASTAAPAATNRAESLGPALPALSSTVVVRTGTHPDYFRLAFDWPGKTKYTVERRGDRIVITFDRAAPVDPDALNRGLPPANRPATVGVENGRTVVTVPMQGDAQIRDFTSGNTVVVDLLPQATPKTPTPPPDTKTANAAAKPADKAAEAKAAADKAAADKKVADAKAAPAQRGKTPPKTEEPPPPPGVVTVTIPWEEPAAAAVFRRAEYTWVVFDRYKQIDTAALQKAGAPHISFIEQLPVRNNTILRMVTPPDINPAVRRDGLSWVLDFRAMPPRPTRAIEIRPQLRNNEASLYLAVSEAGRTVPIEDPEVGDMLLVVPVIPISSGVFPERSFTDLDLPVTAQGVVVVPKSDSVRAQASRNGVEVEVDGGLVMSKEIAEKGESMVVQQDTNRVFNISDWQIGRADDYVRNKQALEAALMDERPEVKQEARFRLARFEFANGFYPEVLGILEVMRGTDPNSENTAQYRALKGATEMMMRRWQEAAEDLNHLSLANDEEVRFWLAAARAKMGKPEAQAATMIQTGSSIRDYPLKVRNTLALIALEAATASGDESGARGFLDILRKELADLSQQPMIDYLDGKLNQKFGEQQVALSQFRKAEAGANLMYAVLAQRDRMELEHQLGTLQTPELIEGLEKLRYRWRGDDVELGFLLRLAELYADQKDYGTALRTLKLATEYFRDDPRVETAAVKMSEMFEELYLNGASEKLSPVTAIGLFDEFRSLVPPGEKGDEMVRKLADRLVSVDLLESAAILLERQVQFRVTGAEKARIGARLALVYLLDRQPQKALDTLRDSQVGEAGRELNAMRRRLEARALTDMGKVDEAILLLGADTSIESRQLRAEIYWRAQDWSNAAKSIAELVPEAEQVTKENARSVLDWATALTLAGDDRTITRVRQRYMAPMQATPYRDAFALITTPKERGMLDVKAVRSQIEQAEHFKSFMVEYKDMLGQKPLSAIN